MKDLIDKDKAVYFFQLWLSRNKKKYLPLRTWENSIQITDDWIEFYWQEPIETGLTCHTRILPITAEGKRLFKNLTEKIYIPLRKIIKTGVKLTPEQVNFIERVAYAR